MRWKKIETKEGDFRTRRKFAWFPTQVEDYTVWFEFYIVKEQYKTVAVLEEGHFYPELRWVIQDKQIACYYY